MDYVDNKEFYKEIVKYKEDLKHNPDCGIGTNLAIMIERTVRGLAHRWNFRDYPFIEEMIGDGIYHCLKYVHNFDLNRKNVHAYVSHIAHNAFVQRINTEKKHLYTKYKYQMSSDSVLNLENRNNDQIEKGNVGDFAHIDKFIEEYENTNRFKKWLA